jgi:hypothetical protein
MGKFDEKVREHFWMLISSSMGDIGDEEAFKERYSPVFKINTKEAFKLVEDHVWTILYSVTRKTKDPTELRTKLEPVAQFDKGKVKEHIWNILIFSLGENREKDAFREQFEPVLKINSKEAYKLVEDRVWKIFYSVASKIKDPTELRNKLEQVVQIDVKPAAEMIKEVNPEKHKLLLIYK